MAIEDQQNLGNEVQEMAELSAEITDEVALDEQDPKEDSSLDSQDDFKKTQAQAEKSSNIVSILVVISRITGFMRTYMQAFALGVTGLASTYTVADAMPNTLYELVLGGMLITSFLPVYLNVKKRSGKEGAAAYASNLLSIVLLLTGALTIVSFIFAAPIIWTQSAGAADGFDTELSVWFFRWFAVEIVLYALSSIISGVLNAERDYWHSSAAPILNNIVIILAFALYGTLVNSGNISQSAGVIILAIGNPLGVASQVFIQLPALHKHGIKFTPRVNFHDPALKETLTIGLPTVVATLASFPTTAVMSSCALSITPAGASIAYYSRVWYVLAYSVFAVPISTTMFTELSSYRVKGDNEGFMACFNAGMRKILFTLIPCTMLLIVFAPALITIFAAGKFDTKAVTLTVGYLRGLALALPFYGLCSHLQKACSSLMRMNFYAFATCIAAVVQIAICLIFTPVFGLYVVPVSSAFFYGAIDIATLVRIRGEVGPLGLRSVAKSCTRSFILGLLGSLVGWGIFELLTIVLGPCYGIVRGLLYAAVAGLPALCVTFGVGYVMGISDAPFFDAIFGRLLPKRTKTTD